VRQIESDHATLGVLAARFPLLGLTAPRHRSVAATRCQAVRMANRLAGITIDCADTARLASFWSALLDIAVTSEHGDDAGWATVGSRLDDRPRLTFQRV